MRLTTSRPLGVVIPLGVLSLLLLAGWFLV